jgi:hypothetical protein
MPKIKPTPGPMRTAIDRAWFDQADLAYDADGWKGQDLNAA